MGWRCIFRASVYSNTYCLLPQTVIVSVAKGFRRLNWHNMSSQIYITIVQNIDFLTYTIMRNTRF